MRYLTRELICQNRAYVNAVTDWLPADASRASQHNYGVPVSVLSLLNRPIDTTPTYTDVLTAVALEFDRPIRYLEIGVSVGKNFYCLTRALTGSTLVGLDWETPNPVLERLLTPLADSDRPLPTYAAGSNRVYYVQGDEFEARTWEQVAGWQFDVIFSDAQHKAEALLAEYEMMVRFDILDPRRYFLMWDDLTPWATAPMNRAYRVICDRLRRRSDPSLFQTGMVMVNGWIGQHERPHLVGFANSLGITVADLRTALAAVR